MCGIEALLLALALGSELVEKKHSGPVTSINAVCGCECLGVGTSAYYMCEGAKAAAREEAEREHNRKVDEFKQIVKMCGAKPARDMTIGTDAREIK